MDVGFFGSQLGSVFSTLWQSTLGVIPGIVGAVIILLIGWLVGWFLSYAVEKALSKMNLDKIVIEKTGIKDMLGKFKLSHFLALVVKWYVFILFFPPAAEVVELNSFSSLLVNLSLWVPNIIAAVFVAIFGILVANYTKKKVQNMSFHNSGFVGGFARFVILLFAFLIALEQIGINISLARESFLIVLAGIVFALSLGFGLGMRDDAKALVKKWRKKI